MCVMNLRLLGYQATRLCFVPIMPVSIVTTKGSSVDGPPARGFPFPSLLATVPFSETSTLKKKKKKKNQQLFKCDPRKEVKVCCLQFRNMLLPLLKVLLDNTLKH